MYVYMYICVYIYTYIYVYVCLYICLAVTTSGSGYKDLSEELHHRPRVHSGVGGLRNAGARPNKGCMHACMNA